MISPTVRKFGLTTHIGSSVGWFGSVLAFLALAIYGMTGGNLQTVRAAYLSMNLIGWWIIVPLSLAALVTGIVQSLISPWGLFRHYWVVIKLMITIVATALLLLHMQPVGHLARVVAARTLEHGELAGIRLQLVADAGAALVALLIALVLSVYKPQGLTAYGRRKKREKLRRGTISASNQTC
ncbi:MAG TPA: hypothetical protein VFP26_10570 [Gemmatimonadaceae bacterium]|nr:hypothetical protein [Gemmatimonadaceae bacterium]